MIAASVAVAEREDRELRALEPLLDDEPLACATELTPAPDPLDGRTGLGGGLAHDHALAAGESVSLDDERAAVIAHDWAIASSAAAGPAKVHVRGCGTPAAASDVRGPGLARLDPRGGGRRPERRDPAAVERVDDPEGERVVGPDDDEVGALGRAPGRDRRRRRSPRSARASPAPRSRRCPVPRRARCRVGRSASFQQIACSRPPPPTTRTRGGAQAHRHAPPLRRGRARMSSRSASAARRGSSAKMTLRDALMSRPRPAASTRRRDGLRDAAALRADAGDEERHLRAQLAGASQLGRVGRPDDEHAVAVLVPLVADAARDDLPQRLAADDAGPGARPSPGRSSGRG